MMTVNVKETKRKFCIVFQAFNPESEFHSKNKSRRDRMVWEDKLEGGKLYSLVSTNTYKEPHGWLTGLINRVCVFTCYL